MINFKNTSIISAFLLLFSFSYADGIKEIKLLDDYSKEILGDSSTKIKKNGKVSKIEKINTINKKENKSIIDDIPLFSEQKKILNFNSSKNVSPDSIVDIYEKTSKDDIVYRKDTDKPFTGFFGIVLDGKIEYYEGYKNGILDGETAWFSRTNGIKLLSELYSKGKLNGEQKTFYENGEIKSIVYYKNNRINGLVTYDETGKILHKSIFKKGTGVWKFFWSNGKISEEGRYVSWRKNGTWKKYRKDGSLEKITVYKNGSISKQVWK